MFSVVNINSFDEIYLVDLLSVRKAYASINCRDERVSFFKSNRKRSHSGHANLTLIRLSSPIYIEAAIIYNEQLWLSIVQSTCKLPQCVSLFTTQLTLIFNLNRTDRLTCFETLRCTFQQKSSILHYKLLHFLQRLMSCQEPFMNYSCSKIKNFGSLLPRV